jgi:hypothetical protein
MVHVLAINVFISPSKTATIQMSWTFLSSKILFGWTMISTFAAISLRAFAPSAQFPTVNFANLRFLICTLGVV